MSSAQSILTALGLGAGVAYGSGTTSDAIDSATNTQLDSNVAAALIYQQGSEAESAAILQAAGISAGAAKEASLVAKDYYDQAIAQQEKALNYQQEMYKEAVAYQKPYYDTGEWALGELKTMMTEWDGSTDAYEKSPYYDFVQSETIKGLDQSAAASGKLQSGAQQKAVMQYSKDLATTDYDNWLQRYYDSLTPYQYSAGMGQNSANALSSAATGAANTASGIYANESNLLGASGNTQANYTNQAGQAEANGVAAAGAVTGDMYNTLAGLERDRGDISAYGDVQQANNTTSTMNAIGGIAGYVAKPLITAATNAVGNWFSDSEPTSGIGSTDTAIPDAYNNASQNFLSEYYVG